MRYITLYLVLFWAGCGFCFADDNNSQYSSAPFGLKWGMSVAEVKALGITLSGTEEIKTFGLTYGAVNLPKSLSDADFVGLSFGFKDKLWRLVVVGRKISNDPYGYSVKRRYNELVSALISKYGHGASEEYQDTSVWNKPEYFLMGINTGRSWCYTNFETTDIFVQISIDASSQDTSNWRIIYEFKPLRGLFSSDQKAHEKDALSGF